jgi:AAA+ superfamily predicted ATPase
VNVLIKEIDGIEYDKCNLAVILITNRMASLDPAVIRRACLHLEFKRPNETDLEMIFKNILSGTEVNEKQIKELTDFSKKQKIPYSYSDLFQRVAKQALLTAIARDVAFDSTLLLEVLKKTQPTPLIIDNETKD